MSKLILIWAGCAILNVYNIARNSAREKDYEMFIPAMILGIAFSPIMTIIGIGTVIGERQKISKGDRNGS